MRKTAWAAALIASMLLLEGCSYIDKMTGSTDDTVLPGTREDAIPGKSKFPEGPDATVGGQTGSAEPAPDATAPAPCPEDKPDCAKSDDGTFSDPQ